MKFQYTCEVCCKTFEGKNSLDEATKHEKECLEKQQAKNKLTREKQERACYINGLISDWCKDYGEGFPLHNGANLKISSEEFWKTVFGM